MATAITGRGHPYGFAKLLDEIGTLDARRRTLAQGSPPPATEIREVWKQMKSLQADVLTHTVEQIARDFQAA